MSEEDRSLSTLLHRAGDGFDPVADPDDLAAMFNRRSTRFVPGERRRVHLGDGRRPPVGRTVRIAATLAVVALAVALPLAYGGGPSATNNPARGATATVSAIRLPAGFVPEGVSLRMSCSSTDFCMIAGAVETGGSKVPAYVVLAGGRVGAPVPVSSSVVHGLQFAELSCSSASYCVAVTRASHGAVYFAAFDGTAWTSLPSPAGFGAIVHQADGTPQILLSCAGDGSCTLVATTFKVIGPELTAQLSDGAWTVLPSLPDAAHDGYLTEGLACTGATDCTLTGQLTTAVDCKVPVKGCVHYEVTIDGHTAPLRITDMSDVIVHWDGARWRLDPLPPHLSGSWPAGIGGPSSHVVLGQGPLNRLQSVSCTPSRCLVLSVFEIGRNSSQSIDLLSQGQLSFDASLGWPPQADQIACTSPTACVVTGLGGYPETGRTQKYWYLVGTAWHESSFQLPSSEYLALFGDLSCTSDGNCFELYSTDTYHPYASGSSYVLDYRLPGA